ncbi:NAD-dependent epimerase/dehydratase family protein [Calidifontibacter indicus]|uniref:NAD-dependent epimerase/dehydratase family protein n=1 Tax=Calidifontibacter indicus TaxID=419650 RepID=UPI003D7067C6
MTAPPRVAVIGGTGFVGSAVVDALTARGAEPILVRAPRLSQTSADDAIDDLRGCLDGCVAVVNAAGLSDAVSGDADALDIANGRLPGIIAQVCRDLDVFFVHVSSAAVQGDREELDNSPQVDAQTPYSRSKALGEAEVRERGGRYVIYRPPGVHAPSRRVTQQLIRVASSPLATFVGDGTYPTAQALLPNVADAIAFLALLPQDQRPPSIVHHPSEGLTTRQLLELLGGRPPRRLPVPAARGATSLLDVLSKVQPALGGHRRRLEMLWFGQRQAPSWLTGAGWRPVADERDWEKLRGAE